MGLCKHSGVPEEDSSSDFKQGDWTVPYLADADKVLATIMQKWMLSNDILLGRNTFQIWEAYWPKHAEMWAGIREVIKYVLSMSLNHSDWQNSVFLKNVDEVRKLKASEGGVIKVHGSANMTQTIFKHDLVDELCLMTFPIILGTGKGLFAEDSAAIAFELTDHFVTSSGVVFTYYNRAGKVKRARWANNE